MPEHVILSYGINPSLWIKSLLFTLICIICIIGIGYFLPKNTHKILFTKFVGFLLFFRFAFLHGYMLGMGHWSIIDSLPFHLCGISSIACILIMIRISINKEIKYNQSIFEYLVLLGIPSGLHSILTPEFIHGWDGFYFYEFYISHGAIFLVPLYLTIVFGYTIRPDSWKTAFINGLLLAFTVGLINVSIGYFYGKLPNYMYICEAPIADNPLLLTSQWPYYFPMIVFFMFIHILVIFYTYKLIGRVRK